MGNTIRDGDRVIIIIVIIVVSNNISYLQSQVLDLIIMTTITIVRTIRAIMNGMQTIIMVKKNVIPSFPILNEMERVIFLIEESYQLTRNTEYLFLKIDR